MANILDALTLKDTSTGKVTEYEIQDKGARAQIAKQVAASTDSNADYAAEVVDARVGADGESYASLGEAVRGQREKSKGEILSHSKALEKLLPEAISVENLVDGVVLGNTSVNYNTGKIEYRLGYSSTEFIPVKSTCLRVSTEMTIHCYDENQNWIRVTAPLKQGDKRRVYLGPDVKYIRLCSDKDLTLEGVIWTDYIFDFKGEKVDYYYNLDTSGKIIKQEGAKSVQYVFEYHFIGIPLYGTSNIHVATDSGVYVKTLGATTPVYTSKKVGDDPTIKVTFPYHTLITELEYNLQVGKPLNQLSCCLYGTSITNVNSEGKFPQNLARLMNCEVNDGVFTVRGISGGKYAEQIKTNILSHNDTFELIILEGCVNDWYYGVPIEDLRSSIHDIMEHLTGKAENIVFVIDHTNRSYGSIIGGSQVVVNGCTQREYYLKCAEIFSSYGVVIIDAGMLSGINEFKEQAYVDQIHHSNYGGYLFAKAIYDELIRLSIFQN